LDKLSLKKRIKIDLSADEAEEFVVEALSELLVQQIRREFETEQES